MATRKKTTRKRPSARETAARNSARRQIQAVILFAVAVLVFCLAVIKGENVWTWLHDFLLGLFSFSAYVLPLLLGFVAIMLALEKDTGSVATRTWQCSVFVVLLNSVVYAFAVDSAQVGYFGAIAASYTDGVSYRGGGALGALLGWPMEKLFGDTGAKIIIILLAVVFLMLVTGTTIMAVLRAARKPVDKTKETIENAINQTAERIQAGREKSESIDIDLGEGYATTGRKRGRKKMEEPAVEEEEIPFATDTVLPVEIASDKLSALEKAAASMNGEEEEDSGLTTAEAEKEIQAEVEAAEDAADVPAYRYPPLSLLEAGSADDSKMQDNDRMATGNLLVNTLKDFGISTKLSHVTCGPSVTRYELEPSAGVKISRITGLSDDIALRLATTGVRIEAPIPNKAAVGIEVPNKARRKVGLRSLLDTTDYRGAKGKLTVALGQDIEGRTVLADLAKMPHLLIAGTTGSGKSVCTNSMIQSVLFRSRPDEVKMILIDPKKVEFGVYNGIPHLLVPVVTDPRKAAGALSWAVNEMLKRYQMFAESKARDIGDYNEIARRDGKFPPLPLILIVIDELADLMMAAANEVEDSICRLAQMARAAGMHMVIATQRPSVDVITGLIKANIPSRLALTVASAVDSRTILDAGGAEKLLGYGDMLFMPLGQSKPTRVQGCFVTNQEVERVVDFLKSTDDKPQEYDQEIIDEIEKQAAAAGKSAGHSDAEEGDDEVDEALPQAIEIAVEAGQISTSMLQRKMRFGYARAGRIIDQMEQRGIIGPSQGSKPREVLITRQQWIEMNMNSTEE
ncbi:MAG: DNA translocase FtsK 4TM domain-containing protein [Clostridia bacterium]|nr:DNA translocase FtsK 4TM domain-containing protein [Clostridia bacterium]